MLDAMRLAICEHYFRNFVDANNEGVSALLSDDVTLTDWEIHVEGRKDVMAAFDNIWSALSDINVDISNIDLIKDRAYCTITINSPDLDGPIDVIDVIGFDNCGMISSITAYKR